MSTPMPITTSHLSVGRSMSPPSSLPDHLIRPLQERRRDRQAEGLGGCAEAHHSLKILSAHPTSATNVAGVAKVAFFLRRSASRTPRAREHAVQTWIGTFSEIVWLKISAKGGHPTGTTAFATGCRMTETASPSRKICDSCPASAKGRTPLLTAIGMLLIYHTYAGSIHHRSRRLEGIILLPES